MKQLLIGLTALCWLACGFGTQGNAAATKDKLSEQGTNLPELPGDGVSGCNQPGIDDPGANEPPTGASGSEPGNSGPGTNLPELPGDNGVPGGSGPGTNLPEIDEPKPNEPPTGVPGTGCGVPGNDVPGNGVPLPECDPTACGPVLGLVTVLCADGSIGGNTGKCLVTGTPNGCAWEIRPCP